eukprot:6177858-Pleurochrysis_carterae.AAC.4
MRSRSTLTRVYDRLVLNALRLHNLGYNHLCARTKQQTKSHKKPHQDALESFGSSHRIFFSNTRVPSR